MQSQSEFAAVSLDQWKAQLQKDLKGLEADALRQTTREGFTLDAYYQAENAKFPEVSSFGPGEFPYLRGYNKDSNDWAVVEPIVVVAGEEKAANARALEALQNGATALHFSGTIASEAAFSLLMQGILPQYIHLYFSGAYQWDACRYLSHWCEANQIDTASVQGGVLGSNQGVCPTDTELAAIAQVTAQLPWFRCLWIDMHWVQQKGLNFSYSLASGLAAGIHILRFFAEKGLHPDAIGQWIQFRVSTGTSYFFEIAARRALRALWSEQVRRFGAEHFCSAVASLFSQTSDREFFADDEETNLLRASTMAMSAVIGGTQALEVAPYSKEDGNAARLSRNIQLILKHESYLDQVVDPAGGSWFVETLTHELMKSAEMALEEIEAAGGIRTCIQNGQLDTLAQTFIAEEKAAMEEGKKVRVGVNKFRK